jgi:hypothetical protein
VQPRTESRPGTAGCGRFYRPTTSRIKGCDIIIVRHMPAKIKRLVKAKAMAFTIMRCRYSLLTSGAWYLLRSGTGEKSGSELPTKVSLLRLTRDPLFRGRNRMIRPPFSFDCKESEATTKWVLLSYSVLLHSLRCISAQRPPRTHAGADAHRQGRVIGVKQT